MNIDFKTFLRYWVKQSAQNVWIEVKKPFKSFKWLVVWLLFFVSVYLALYVNRYFTILVGICGLAILGLDHWDKGEWRHWAREKTYEKLGIAPPKVNKK